MAEAKAAADAKKAEEVAGAKKEAAGVSQRPKRLCRDNISLTMRGSQGGRAIKSGCRDKSA